MDNEINEVFELQRLNKNAVKQSSAEERLQKIKRIEEAINNRLPELQEAVYKDLRKSPAEVKLSEVYPVTAEIKHTQSHLKKWMRPKRARTPLSLIGSKNEIHYEPKGAVLIISPWNYPFMLAISPLVSAIAAGNCVILKPSEISANTSKFIKDFITDLFDLNEVAVFEGDVEVGKALLEFPFNHIFFTGSTEVGKKVMAAAAKHLSSVTLELGGKSPTIIDKSSDIKEAAKKIIWGKFLNAGQTCIAPDYVLVHKENLTKFVDEAKTNIDKLYSSKTTINNNPDYCRIINSNAYSRLKNLVDDAVKNGASMHLGDEFENDQIISPTLLTCVDFDAAIMQEEIFGPVLPIITYDTIDDVLEKINSRPNPLALYIFSRNKQTIQEILSNTSAGDTLINDVVVHFNNLNLPFGGSNHSGIGKSRGYAGFKSFSHERAVMRQPKYSMVQLLYPPYTKFTKKLIDITVKYF